MRLKRKGFSLIEALLVLAVLGIILAIGTPNYLRWRASTAVKQAAAQLAQDLDKQRSEARRINQDRQLSFSVDANTYTANGVTKSLPSGVALQSASDTSLRFLAPHGTTTTDKALRSYTLSWTNNGEIQRTVRVVGITGKVIVQ